MIELFSGILPFLLIIFLVLMVLNSFSSNKTADGNIAYQHYYLVNSLHSKAELKFDAVLHAKLSPSFRICPKVRLSDFAKVQGKGVDSKIAYGLRRRCDPRHADWLITLDDGTPACWIELDDKSHNTKKARLTDKFKNDLADAIGIPLVRIRVGENYHSALEKLPL